MRNIWRIIRSGSLVVGFVFLAASPCLSGTVSDLTVTGFRLEGRDFAFTLDTCDDIPRLFADADVSLHLTPGSYNYRFDLLRDGIVIASNTGWMGSVTETDTSLTFARDIAAATGIYSLEVRVEGSSSTASAFARSIPFTLNQLAGPPTARSSINGVSASEEPIPVCGAGPIVLDGTPSSCAGQYFLGIQLADRWWNGHGGEFGQWLTQSELQKYGSIGAFDIKRWAEDHHFVFVGGQYYRVKLAVGAPWSEDPKLISIQPAVAALKINGAAGNSVDIVGPDYPIFMDGSGSSCANGYFLSVQISDANGNPQGFEAMRWLTADDFNRYGPLHHFDVKRFAESQWTTFVPGQYYRVKLAVGPMWNETTTLIHIKPQEVIEPGHVLPLTVLTHVQELGDRAGAQGEWVGTRGQTLQMEGFEVRFSPVVPGLGLEYMAHLAERGDTAFVPAGEFVGTRGESRRLEGFAVRLTGPDAARYDLFYQCHLAGLGDSAVLTGSQFCGTRGQSRAIEALRIWIVAK